MKRSSLARVGGVSHVSCIDRRAAESGEGAYAQLDAFGLARIEGLCALFGAPPRRVMARCGGDTEVFLELAGNIHLQYYGAVGVSHDEQSLWVEGPKGSLRATGRWLLWRKRGWPKFLPWGLNLADGSPAAQVDPRALRDAIQRSSEEGRVVELGR